MGPLRQSMDLVQNTVSLTQAWDITETIRELVIYKQEYLIELANNEQMQALANQFHQKLVAQVIKYPGQSSYLISVPTRHKRLAIDFLAYIRQGYLGLALEEDTALDKADIYVRANELKYEYTGRRDLIGCIFFLFEPVCQIPVYFN